MARKKVAAEAGKAVGGATAFGVAQVLVTPPPDHPFYQLIGFVAAEGDRLEHTLDHIIWELSGIKAEIGACITGQLTGTQSRFEAIKALAVVRKGDQALLDELEGVAKKAGKAMQARHRFVHDAWFIGGEQVSQFRRKGKTLGFDEVDEKEAKEAVESIRNRIKQVAELRGKLQKLAVK